MKELNKKSKIVIIIIVSVICISIISIIMCKQSVRKSNINDGFVDYVFENVNTSMEYTDEEEFTEESSIIQGADSISESDIEAAIQKVYETTDSRTFKDSKGVEVDDIPRLFMSICNTLGEYDSMSDDFYDDFDNSIYYLYDLSDVKEVKSIDMDSNTADIVYYTIADEIEIKFTFEIDENNKLRKLYYNVVQEVGDE